LCSVECPIEVLSSYFPEGTEDSLEKSQAESIIEHREHAVA
jgi:hypothetical protein